MVCINWVKRGFLCVGSDCEIWILLIHVMCIWLGIQVRQLSGLKFRCGNCLGSNFELWCIFMGFSCKSHRKPKWAFLFQGWTKCRPTSKWFGTQSPSHNEFKGAAAYNLTFVQVIFPSVEIYGPYSRPNHPNTIFLVTLSPSDRFIPQTLMDELLLPVSTATQDPHQT